MVIKRSRVFPLHHLSMRSSGLVSNQICFRISVKKNGPVRQHKDHLLKLYYRNMLDFSPSASKILRGAREERIAVEASDRTPGSLEIGQPP